MQNLLGGDEIYHYHSKLMMKEPKTGGAHIWHQDYGYIYYLHIIFYPFSFSLLNALVHVNIDQGIQ